MTDEEWLQVLEKKFQVLKFYTSPVRARGMVRMTVGERGREKVVGENLHFSYVFLVNSCKYLYSFSVNLTRIRLYAEIPES